MEPQEDGYSLGNRIHLNSRNEELELNRVSARQKDSAGRQTLTEQSIASTFCARARALVCILKLHSFHSSGVALIDEETGNGLGIIDRVARLRGRCMISTFSLAKVVDVRIGTNSETRYVLFMHIRFAKFRLTLSCDTNRQGKPTGDIEARHICKGSSECRW